MRVARSWRFGSAADAGTKAMLVAWTSMSCLARAWQAWHGRPPTQRAGEGRKERTEQSLVGGVFVRYFRDDLNLTRPVIVYEAARWF